MQSSHLSNYDSNKWVKGCIYAVTCLFRLAVGATFIMSGFVKAVDPWGTIYKFQEYFAALGLPSTTWLVTCSAFALFLVEFLIGVSLVLGSYRRATPICTLCFMAVMLPLTLWIAISDPVAECGCFGDFWILSNWQTFWKNVVITALTIWLVIYNRRVVAVITPALQWIEAVISSVFILLVAFYGYFEQPLLDFRPYPVGQKIVDQSEGGEEDYYTFVYEKDGMEKEFNISDTLPSEEEGWRFKERRLKISELDTSDNPANAERQGVFQIWDKTGEGEMTETVMSDEGEMLMVLMPELDKVSPATTWKINTLYDAAANSGIDMIAVVSGSPEMIEEWEDLSMPRYEIYTADDTVIKQLARGNPSLVYLKDGTIEWKSSLWPVDVDEITKDDHLDTSSFSRDGSSVLNNITYLYLACLAVLIILSLLPYLRNLWNRPNHDDRVPPEE